MARNWKRKVVASCWGANRRNRREGLDRGATLEDGRSTVDAKGTQGGHGGRQELDDLSTSKGSLCRAGAEELLAAQKLLGRLHLEQGSERIARLSRKAGVAQGVRVVMDVLLVQVVDIEDFGAPGIDRAHARFH